MIIDLVQKTKRIEICHDRLAGNIAVHASILFRHLIIKAGFRIKNVDLWQIMSTSDFKIIEVMGRRDLNRTRSLLRIGMLICHDGDQAPDKRQDDVFADQVFVALIICVHGDSCVAQHGLRPCGRNHNISALFALNRVAEVPQAALNLFLFDLKIRDRGAQSWVPIDQTFVFVNQAFFMKLHKDFLDGFRKTFVHCEALATPIAGGAQAPQLRCDRSAAFLFPLPDTLNKSLATHVATANIALFGQLALNDHLRSNAGMVGAWLPEHILAPHPLEANQYVLQRVVERMTHMERARHIRRWDDDGVGSCARFNTFRVTGLKGAGGFPGFVEPFFNVLRTKCLFQHGKSRNFKGKRT